MAAALLASTAFSAPPLYFDGPEVVKLDWATGSPRAADFNGDGLTDIAIINSDRARIEILLQRKDGVKPGEPEKTSREDRWNPILEVSRFEKEPLVIGHAAFAMAVGDWNGDKKPDLAVITDDDKLALRMQDGKGGWTLKKDIALDSTAEDTEVLVAADLNSDARTDLALLTSTRLMVLLQKEKAGEWADPQTYALGESGCAGLHVADLNADSKPDLFYTAPEGDALLVRLQQDDRSYGEEWRIEIPSSRHWLHPVRLGGGKTGVAWIQNETGMVEVARLTEAKAQPDSDRASTIRYAMPPTESKGGAVAYGDLTGDGAADVVMSEPKSARLWLFSGQKNGGFSQGREFPILGGVESILIADADGDKKNDLVLLSSTEKAIGIARWSEGRLAYPEIVHQAKDGESLLTLTSGTIGSLAGSIHAVVEIKSKPQLLSIAFKDKKFAVSSLEMAALTGSNRVNAIRVLDANQDGKGDLAVFSSIGAMQVLLSTADAKTPFKRVEGIPDTFVSKLTPSALTTGDLDGDGKDEFVIAREQLARVFRVNAEGKASIVEQFNAPDASAEIHTALFKRGADKKLRVTLIDTAHSKLYDLAAGADGVYRSQHSHPLPAMTPDQIRLVNGGSTQRLLLLGKSSFQITPLDGDALQLETVSTFDSDLKDTQPADLIPAAFTGQDTDDLALLDSAKSRVIEIFAPTQDKKDGGDAKTAWESTMHFRIFETDPHFRGKSGRENEPHDYTALDLNNDGKLDLVLLCHDRALFYTRK
ncbi:MAG: VCBS repeat-containing protein [Verrucomicrobiaceae bacterium]|nr:VCBS repeat-containing protein [Verrucomicrobiaceae bacterium]